ncbi:MAG: hypothetical protein ACKOXB_03200 [Flavobacteriales bacterium]
MDLHARKLQLIQFLSLTTSEVLIDKMEKLIQKDKTDFWDELSPELQSAIEKSVAQANSGKLIPHDEVMKKYSQWV